ncbi:hemin uptake protein HemP [Dyella sp. A6]|uniref:hemin uptake protein HemP n=1 Tax=Dyella aluminiiresistens TaxID=3069105 RepID=UPI002E79498C|nr:hemin uptake protein HemP [Dyella sp. A6]
MSVSTTLGFPAEPVALPRPFRLLSLKKTAATPDAPVRRMSSQALLAGGRELVIQHQGSEYHLRLTRNDKLILTK